MLKAHASLHVNRFVGLHDPREDAAVCEVLSDDCYIANQPAAARSVLESGPAATSTIARTGDAPISLWWSVLASFAEGFGAYSMPLYPTADFPVQAILVASKESLQHHGGRELTATAHGYEAGLLSKTRNFIQLGQGSALDARPPRHRNLLAFIYDAGAALWAHWRREREIKRAVAALAEFDDRTLRDIGISSRAEIEQVVRYCHDC
jgi:uncharacterized protein YjiS (DUF1127 family)